MFDLPRKTANTGLLTEPRVESTEAWARRNLEPSSWMTFDTLAGVTQSRPVNSRSERP